MKKANLMVYTVVHLTISAVMFQLSRIGCPELSYTVSWII